MAFNQQLIDRIRVALINTKNVEERKMFGGYFFLVNGKMCVSVRGDDMMVKIDHKDYEAALAEPGTHPMIKRNGPVIGSVFIENMELTNEAVFQKWINKALEHNNSNVK